MRKSKDLNNISEKLNKETTLGKNDVVEFRLLNIHQVNGKPVIPQLVSIPPRETVYDPYDMEYKEIGLIQSILPDGTARVDEESTSFRKELFGRIVCSGSNAKDREVYARLYLSNYNASNLNRDETVEKIFEMVDPVARAKDTGDILSKKEEAFRAIREANAELIRSWAVIVNEDETEKLDLLRGKLMIFADENPGELLELIVSDDLSMMGVIRQADKENHIKYDGRNRTWSWVKSKKVICSVPTKQSDRYQGLLVYLKTHDLGPSVYDEIFSKIHPFLAKDKEK